MSTTINMSEFIGKLSVLLSYLSLEGYDATDQCMDIKQFLHKYGTRNNLRLKSSKYGILEANLVINSDHTQNKLSEANPKNGMILMESKEKLEVDGEFRTIIESIDITTFLELNH